MRIAAVGRAFPRHYYDQETLIAALERIWAPRQHRGVHRLRTIHRNALVDGRHLALPIEDYAGLTSFTDANEAFIRCASDLGAEALGEALAGAGLTPEDVDHIIFVSITGLATPSIDARLVNRLGLRRDVKRTPIFGLGCVAGAAGLARAADYLRGHADEVAALVSVELCSLTLQREDLTFTNLIASGLFGDGAASAIVTGDARRPAAAAARPAGPAIVDTRSVFYRDTEGVMGWDVTADGFRVVLSADVPKIIAEQLGADVDAFLGAHRLRRADIASWVCHPGGPHVLRAVQTALGLDDDALALSWESLRRVGNLSSAAVLVVLRETMDCRRPLPGSWGLLLSLGPGLCAELVLLRW
ncbi:MAG TPA: 3-oxoacyl-[acyl-carrier-protein] synthase III C-terminal domain-containing protein [Candidatus Binatia bacterium]|jgi:alkylresorcinol/alkylpyrone synthase